MRALMFAVGIARRLKSRATSTKSPCGDYAASLSGTVRAGGLRLRSPRIFSPGGPATTYDACFINVQPPGKAGRQ